MLVARAGRFAGVDLVPHLDRLADPVFRGIVEAICDAGVELENDVFRRDARLHGVDL